MVLSLSLNSRYYLQTEINLNASKICHFNLDFNSKIKIYHFCQYNLLFQFKFRLNNVQMILRPPNHFNDSVRNFNSWVT